MNSTTRKLLGSLEEQVTDIRLRLGVLVVAALTVMTFALASSGSASAATFVYCDNLETQPNTPCPRSGVGYFYENSAAYIGAGTVSVCERAIRVSGNVVISRRCNNGSITGLGDLIPEYNAGHQIAALAGNDSNYVHHITGKAYY